eukprot:403350948
MTKNKNLLENNSKVNKSDTKSFNRPPSKKQRVSLDFKKSLVNELQEKQRKEQTKDSNQCEQIKSKEYPQILCSSCVVQLRNPSSYTGDTFLMNKEQKTIYMQTYMCYQLSSTLNPSTVLNYCQKCFRKTIYDLDFVKEKVDKLLQVIDRFHSRLEFVLSHPPVESNSNKTFIFENPIQMQILQNLQHPDHSLAIDVNIENKLQDYYNTHIKALSKAQSYIQLLNQNESQLDEVYSFLNSIDLKDLINLRVNQVISSTLQEQSLILTDTLDFINKQYIDKILQIQELKKTFMELNHLKIVDEKVETVNETPQEQNLETQLSEQKPTYTEEENGKTKKPQLLMFEDYFIKGFESEIQRLQYGKFCQFHSSFVKNLSKL